MTVHLKRFIPSCLFVLVSLSVLGWAGSIPTVTLTAAGPDVPIPVGSEFYLQGDVTPDIVKVVPIFVRTGTRTMFGVTGSTCFEFASHLGKFAGKSDTIGKPALGAGTAGQVWTAHDGLDPDTAIFIPGIWTPSPTSTPPASGSSGTGSGSSPPTAQFKTLVPSDSFFTSAGSFCLLTVETSKGSKPDTTSLRTILFSYGSRSSTCAANDAKCIANAQSKFSSDRNAALVKLSDSSRKDAIEKSNNLLGTTTTLVKIGVQVQVQLQSFANTGLTIPTAGFTLPLAMPLDEAALPFRSTASDCDNPDWLAISTMLLLSEHGGLLAQVPPKVKPKSPPPARQDCIIGDRSPAAVAFFSKTGTVPVKQLRILADTETIELVSNPASTAAADRTTATLKTSDLTIAGLDVTLRDLFELMRGNLRLASGYTSATDIQSHLAQIFAQTDVALSADDKAYLDAIRARALLLHTAIVKLLAASANGAASSEASAALGKWIGPLLVVCNNEPNLQAWMDDASNLCVPKGASPTKAWPGYKVDNNNPLAFLAGNVDKYEQAKDTWARNASTLNFSVDTSTTPPGSTIPLPVQYTQSQWVFSYVTPVTGAAFIFPRNASSFDLFYLGAQIHVVPNPVDTPLWTQDNDLYRALALELGLSPNGGSFGPGDRFAAWKGIPPVFIGAAVHLIPYTSFTVGGTLMGRRSTTLTQEEPSAWFGAYVGLNVQINIPDLVVALKGRTSSSSTQQ